MWMSIASIFFATFLERNDIYCAIASSPYVTIYSTKRPTDCNQLFSPVISHWETVCLFQYRRRCSAMQSRWRIISGWSKLRETSSEISVFIRGSFFTLFPIVSYLMKLSICIYIYIYIIEHWSCTFIFFNNCRNEIFEILFNLKSDSGNWKIIMNKWDNYSMFIVWVCNFINVRV